MTNKNFKLVIEYDGTPFFGWQRQKDKISVQGVIEAALSKILNQEIQIAGSGRTDSGVHARAQVAHFHALTNVDVHGIKRGLNSLIKLPVVILTCEQTDDEFHARYHAVSKEYHYHILNREDPCAIGRDYQWHVRKPLNLETMTDCAAFLLGDHDFKSFESTGSPRSSTIRTIYKADLIKHNPDQIIFKIQASGFLKYMVRNIMGTLVHAGLGKISVAEFKHIIGVCDRSFAGPTAPPHGLFLHRVYYSL